MRINTTWYIPPNVTASCFTAAAPGDNKNRPVDKKKNAWARTRAQEHDRAHGGDNGPTSCSWIRRSQVWYDTGTHQVYEPPIYRWGFYFVGVTIMMSPFCDRSVRFVVVFHIPVLVLVLVRVGNQE